MVRTIFLGWRSQQTGVRGGRKAESEHARPPDRDAAFIRSITGWEAPATKQQSWHWPDARAPLASHLEPFQEPPRLNDTKLTSLCIKDMWLQTSKSLYFRAVLA